MDDVSQRALSSNRALIDRFMGCVPLREVEAILAGIRSSQDDKSWDADLFSRFKDRVDNEEASTHRMLEKLLYYLDEPTTVAMILGPGRPEKVSFR